MTDNVQAIPPNESQSPVSKKTSRLRVNIIFSLFILAFWAALFAHQYLVISSGNREQSLIRSFGLGGAYLITFSLLSSVLFRLLPKLARQWRWRRRLGVAGVCLIICHVATALGFYFAWDLTAIFWNLNPVINHLLFGLLALIILLIMALTSSDWMVDHIGSKRWKRIHRFVYIAYAAMIFHFMLAGWTAMQHPVGYALFTLAGMTVLGHIYLFGITIYKRKFPKVATLVGLILIAASSITGFAVYLNIFKPLPADNVASNTTERYKNSEYNFTIGYSQPLQPIEQSALANSSYIPLCDPTTSIVCLVYPQDRFPESNFDGAAVSVSLLTDYQNAESCAAAHNGEHYANFRTMTINDKTFSIFVAGEAAMSYRSQAQRYRSWYDDRCYQIETRFNTIVPEVYEPGTIKPITGQDETEIYDALIQSLISFEFIK